MPKLAKQYEQRYSYYNYEEVSQNVVAVPRKYREHEYRPHVVSRRPVKRNTAKIERNRRISQLVSVSVLLLLGIFVLPSGFKNISRSIFTKSPYPSITTDYKQIVYPSLPYLNNHLFLDELMLSGAELKKPQMSPLPTGQEMTSLENQLDYLSTLYPRIHPSIFVWDYNTKNFADINGEELFSAASIIKIPVLLQLFKSIEAGQVSLTDKMPLTEYYRSEGSGDLQFKAENSKYSLDTLARVMITNSDNSATNMIMSDIGSMTDVNRGIRDWGLKQTHVKNWLPDLAGTNHTTARDLARMLYNIDNPKFLSPSSTEKIFEYMGQVKNNRLIQAGLGSGAKFHHKTGDIGKMLGDAGIVTMPNGNKYIVVILANRPYNSPDGKDFIVKASEIIYNYMNGTR